eukprot:2946481-Prymnesium_polylepis.3
MPALSPRSLFSSVLLNPRTAGTWHPLRSASISSRCRARPSPRISPSCARAACSVAQTSQSRRVPCAPACVRPAASA